MLQIDRKMRSRSEYITLIQSASDVLRAQFGVKSLRLFGSVARDEQKEGSDVDVCVEMEPNLFRHVGLKYYLEDLLNGSVDVIRVHNNMNKFLKQQIEKDGIYVFS